MDRHPAARLADARGGDLYRDVMDSLDPEGARRVRLAGPGGAGRVVRRGSWRVRQRYPRITAQDHHAPDKPEITIGFRCVIPIPGDN